MAPPRPAPSPAARRLQRLRIRMTLSYAASTAIALIVLSLVALAVNGRILAAASRAELRHRVDLAYSLLAYDDDGTLDLSGLEGDEITVGPPDLYVLERPDVDKPTVEARFQPRRTDLDVGADITRLANDAIADDVHDYVESTSTIKDGTQVDTVATAILDQNDRQRAAIVVIDDSRINTKQQRDLALALAACTGVLVLVSALIGYLLAGRSIRPAADALDQQERFLTDAAHELRTPVARLRTAAEGALASDDPAQASAALRSMVTLAEQAGEVVDNLLLLARIEAGAITAHPERLRLDQLVGDIAAHHSDVYLDVEPSVVSADPVLLRRAIDNLIVNAVRHGNGNQVVVRVRGGAVTVADRGPGIDLEVLPNLFTRFVISPTTGGSGLGLPIVQEIAIAHGGTVEGHNRVDGTGAEFVFTLPPSAVG